MQLNLKNIKKNYRYLIEHDFIDIVHDLSIKIHGNKEFPTHDYIKHDDRYLTCFPNEDIVYLDIPSFMLVYHKNYGLSIDELKLLVKPLLEKYLNISVTSIRFAILNAKPTTIVC